MTNSRGQLKKSKNSTHNMPTKEEKPPKVTIKSLSNSQNHNHKKRKNNPATSEKPKKKPKHRENKGGKKTVKK